MTELAAFGRSIERHLLQNSAPFAASAFFDGKIVERNTSRYLLKNVKILNLRIDRF